MTSLKERYKKSIKQELHKKFGYSNVMQIPRLEKVVINMGVAEALKDKNAIQGAVKELTLIAGQFPIVTKAKKAISNFKLREGQPLGVKVTLRGKKMWDFLARSFNIAFPRIRDFRGFATKCDGRGNYTLGINDQQIFSELNLDEVGRAQGMNITFVTNAKTDEECIELLRLLGLPFKNLPVTVAS